MVSGRLMVRTVLMPPPSPPLVAWFQAMTLSRMVTVVSAS